MTINGRRPRLPLAPLPASAGGGHLFGVVMTNEERAALIDQLDRSFMAMPSWAKAACKHSIGAPECHPETGKRFESFREVIECAADHSLEILRSDFEDNGDLLPVVPRQ